MNPLAVVLGIVEGLFTTIIPLVRSVDPTWADILQVFKVSASRVEPGAEALKRIKAVVDAPGSPTKEDFDKLFDEIDDLERDIIGEES